ncbi:MAG: MoxR family ATPase, partial [Anaerolineales bacterium]|nr:MoxR family ATPase [Anaerolineales bacterium]
INRATPNTNGAMLNEMQEQTVIGGKSSKKMVQILFVVVTQKPKEMEGTYPLPEAQLDRFLFKIDVRFPSAADLNEILLRTTGEDNPRATPATSGATLIEMQDLARKVPIASNVLDFISRLVVATHPGDTAAPLVNRYVRYGSSPRGAQALVLGAKITALFAGRYNVSYEDVTAVAAPALRHRLLLNFEAQAENISTDAIVADLIQHVSQAKK